MNTVSGQRGGTRRVGEGRFRADAPDDAFQEVIDREQRRKRDGDDARQRARELEYEVRNLIFQIASDVVASNDATLAKLLYGARDRNGDFGISADVIGLLDERTLG